MTVYDAAQRDEDALEPEILRIIVALAEADAAADFAATNAPRASEVGD